MVAVSGGADSILTACLVYNFFLEKKYSLQNLFFIHCNHNTRPGNAHDEEFMKTFFEGTQLIIVKRNASKKSIERHNENLKYSENFHDVEIIPTTFDALSQNKMKESKISKANR